jgi:hypothetical protein
MTTDKKIKLIYTLYLTNGGADKKLDSQWAPKGAKSTCIHRNKLMLH